MLPLYIYYECLEVINGVKFTPREIDVISCVVNGRSTKTIPLLLSIAQKTVSVHLENIRAKSGCTSRESIIDFIEASDQHSLIKNEYYSSLLIQNSFEKCLRELAKGFSAQGPGTLFLYKQEQNVKSIPLYYLEQHLKLADFEIKNRIQKDGKPCILTQFHANSQLTIELLLAQEENGIKSIENGKGNIIDLSEQKNYYNSVLKILKIILPDKQLDKIFSGFDSKKTENNTIEILSRATPTNSLVKKFPFSIKAGKYLAIGCSSLLLLFFLYKADILKNKIFDKAPLKEYSIRSDLDIPTESVLLNRGDLLSQIEKSFKQQPGIQITALIGIGGAGKTTLAHLYAQQQKGQLVWEVHADTKAHLNASFENLANRLAQTDQDKMDVRAIYGIKDPQRREKELIQFVKTQLKLIPNWFLIFDNVENLAGIQNYFPQDAHTWGNGKIILTSQDHNLQNSNQIDHVVFVRELDERQKFSLFSKIMNHGKPEFFTVADSKETKQFLNSLPPFPLDISMAAYYLKVANISYSQYLENLKKSREDFDAIQTNILKKIGSYNKTRYGIITLSLKEIISYSQDFAELFLFVSLLNAHHIPRNLLEKYKNHIIVDNFIYHLKKYSLITHESLPSSTQHATICLHQSTQNASILYLTQQLNLTKGSPTLEQMAKNLDDYADKIIEEENFSAMQHVADHLENFLSYSHLLPELSIGVLGSKLGSLYYFTNNEKSLQTLEDNLKILKNQNLRVLNSENCARIAQTFLNIGATYTELRLYKEAQELLERAIHLFEHEKIKNYSELSWALSHLGNVHRRFGNYEKAKGYLEKSINLHKQYGRDKKRLARSLAYLGSTYNGLGEYKKSINILEESLAIYQVEGKKEHYRVGWIQMQLASSFRRMGDYKQAEAHLEKSLDIYKKQFEANHIRIGWALFHLATIYKGLGKEKQASKMFEKVLHIYSKHCNNENIESARLLREMGRIHLYKNQLNDAEKLVKRSLKILLSHNHVDAYKSLETLGEIYLTKASHPLYIKTPQDSQNFKSQAINTFYQALKIIEQRFPKHSAHLQRVSGKIKTVKK